MEWLTLISIITAILSGATIVLFIIRHWAQLSLLQVERLPEVREAKKKEEILRRRAAQQGAENTEPKMSITTMWFVTEMKRIQEWFRKKVDTLERALLAHQHRATIAIPLTDEEKRAQDRAIKQLLREADAALVGGAFETAEKQFIAVLNFDHKSAAAYQGLGDVYFAEKQFTEARQTYRYAIYLQKNNEHALVRLAEIAEAEGDLHQAVELYQQAVLLNDSISTRFVKLYELLSELNEDQTALAAIQQALVLEPQNPKYLDNFITASILVGDKKLAEDGYQRLRMVNPENQKLATFRERIDSMVAENG